MAAAIEEGLVTPTARSRRHTIHHRQRPDVPRRRRARVEKLTVAGVLAKSSNTGTVQIGSKLTPEQRYKYLTAFGLGTKTNVGLPGESNGILADYKKWDGRQKYAVLFGQALSVTALQTTQVYQTIANGGVQVQPTSSPASKTRTATSPLATTEEPKRVVSEKTAKEVLTMLESSDGATAPEHARGDRRLSRGWQDRYGAGDVPERLVHLLVASFAGIAPADDPRIVVTVIIYDPQTSIYGGEVAAPCSRTSRPSPSRSSGCRRRRRRRRCTPSTWK